MPNNTDDKYSVPAFQQKRLQQRARVAQLVLVALLAGFVGAGWGYLKGEVAVLSGQSEMASVLLAQNTELALGGAYNGSGYTPFSTTGSSNTTTSSISSQFPSGSFNSYKPASSSDIPAGKQPGSITDSLNADNKNPSATQQQKISCIVGGEDKCLNKCSASYVRNSSSGSVATIDCYGKEGDPAAPLIKRLAECMKVGGNAQTVQDELKKKLCMVDKPPVVKAADGSTTTSTSSNSGTQAVEGSTLSMPKDCVDIANQIIALRGKGKTGEQSSVDCSIGASVCSEIASAPTFSNNSTDSGSNTADLTPADTGKFTCKAKPKEGQGGGGAGKPGEPKSKYEQLKECMAKGGVDALKCAAGVLGGDGDGGGAGAGGGGSGSGARNGVTGSGAGGGMPKPPGGGSGGGSSGGGQQQPQCPAGYVLSNQAPQTQTSSSVNTTGSVPVVYNNSSTTLVCVPANQANAKPPECVFNTSKKNPAKGEKITLTWSTTNTDNGGRVMLSDGTNSGRIEANGNQEVTITSARAYTLTAYNAKGETKECKVEITLGGTGESGTAGAYPPKLSCAPSIIEKGKSATVTWECPTAAKKSAGEGTTTSGDVAGKKTVTPDHNTEYTISCYKTETADLDDEESEDFLGKRTCSVRVAEPEFDIIAYPEKAKRGERVRISWGSLFMKTCQVTGPRGFDYTRPNGVVVTEPFSTNEATAPDRTIRAAVYTIVCESIFGKRYSADVEVDFEN